MNDCLDRCVIIIIIIVHFMLAAYRLWHSTVQDRGIQPKLSFSLHHFSASILMRSTSFCSFVCLLSTGKTLYQFNQKSNVKGKQKTKEIIMKDFQQCEEQMRIAKQKMKVPPLTHLLPISLLCLHQTTPPPSIFLITFSGTL